MKVYVVTELDDLSGDDVVGVFSSFDLAHVFCTNQACNLMERYSRKDLDSGILVKPEEGCESNYYNYYVTIIRKKKKWHINYEHSFYISEEELDELCTYEAVAG